MDQGSDELRSSNIKAKNPLKDKKVLLAFYHGDPLASTASLVSMPFFVITAISRLLKEFLPFSRKYNTYLIRHWSGAILNYNGLQLRAGCSFVKGAIISPSCIMVNISYAIIIF